MRKFSTLLLSLLFVACAFGKSVTVEKATQVANNFFAAYSGKSSNSISSQFSKATDGITTYYVFNYSGGGFVVVSADDAATPILAYSTEGYLETEFSNPSTAYWFDSYSREIAHAIATEADNSASIGEWNRIINNDIDAPTFDVAPLLTTLWDQGQWYNFYCPVAAGGPGGKAWAGCVATTMGQIMKYHNFPATGVGSHSYIHPTYGQQSANFGATNYNFAQMGNTAGAGAYTQIATLLYHAGVSVNMDYDPTGSGAFSFDVPWAMSSYFNYDNTTIKYAEKASYALADWKALIMSELDASRPVYYSGSGPAGGHAWVCDGYQTSTGKFHMNWGWSGISNGYYAIGALNTGNGTFNSSNAIVCGIKPGNPNLIARFDDLLQNNSVAYGPEFDINCTVVVGTPSVVNLYIDGIPVFNTTQTAFSYPWATGSAALGTHVVKLEAIQGTDTVYQIANIGLSEWISQASGFPTASRGVKYIHAVDSALVWATAYDGVTTTNYIQEFTKTTNGGATWTPGVINNATGLEPGMIFGMSADTAYCPMYKQSGSNPQGIYVTRNGGTTWTRQTSATFSNSASFPNVVHFFNKNDGFCMGDPINNDFEIYTTSNGGDTWTAVPAGNIANPVSGEFGIVGYYSAVGDKAWFGTNMGRVYRTSDKGLHWDASTTSLGAVYVDVEFRDALNGIAANKGTGTTGELSETSDGGITWNSITYTGENGTADFCYVPGTENTWVSTESSSTRTLGAFYSFDGGHSWASFLGTETSQFLAVDFASNHCGYAGGFNTNALENGMNKYVGTLAPGSFLSPVTNLVAQPLDNSVHLTWNEPVTPPLSYNIYRNDTLISNTPSLQYHDYPVSNGQQVYCVSAVYDLGESPRTCTVAWLTVGVPNTDDAAFKVYPNPATEVINIVTPVQFSEVRMINTMGQLVYRNTSGGTNLHILTEGFEPGMYILQISTGTQVISKKVSVNR
jgi:hypothetical protein